MGQVKQGSKTILDLFQASSAKKCRLMTRAMLHHPPKSVNRIISTVAKNCPTAVTYQNDSSDQKIEKMKFKL